MQGFETTDELRIVTAIAPTHHDGPDNSLTDARREARFAASLAHARRHSRRVKRLRRLLPVVGVGLLVSFGGSAFVSAALRGAGLDVGTLDLASLVGGELVMAEPNISGTAGGRRFEVVAERAVQNVSDRDTVRFEDATARVETADGDVTIVSTQALYGIAAETLALTGGIDVTTERDQTARLTSADVDLRTGRVTSEEPVEVTGPQGRITAERLVIEDSGVYVRFEGRVKARFTPAGPD